MVNKVINCAHGPDVTKMAYKDAREWLETLERENELARITTPVHWDLEMGGISVCTGV